MSGLEGDIKCKGAWCGFDAKIVKAAEGDVGIQCGSVGSMG